MGALALAPKIEIEVVPETDLPPHSLEAEASVLSAVILDPTGMMKIIDFLKPEHMFSEAHRRIFEACLAIHLDGKPIDAMLVGDWLRDRKRLAQIGGAGYITEILDACPVVQNVRHHAMLVYEKWRIRQVIRAAQKIEAVGYADYGDPQAFLDRAARALTEIAQQTVLGRPESNRDALVRMAKALAAGSDGVQAGGAEQPRRARGIPTGIHGYDRLTCGLHAGQKTTVTAHPGIGKTAFAMQIGFNVAEGGIGVVVFSTEMSRDELLNREICRRAAIPHDRLQAGRLTPDEWSRYTKAASEIAALPLEIDDTGYTGSIHIGQVCAATRALNDTMRVLHGAPLGLVIIDYIQNLEPAPEVESSKEHEQVKRSTKTFSKLLKSLGIPGIELAQRKPEPIDPKTKTRPTPTKGCVSDSAEIEKSSYVVVCLQRAPLYNAHGGVIGEDENSIVAHVVKHRGGKERPIELRYDGEYLRFSDPNEPGQTISRQYLDRTPEPPQGRFEETENHFTEQP